MDLKTQTINTYNKAAAAYAAKFSGIGRRVADIERGIALVGKTEPKIVEVGCGNGRDAKEMLNVTDDYVGVDNSEAMIALAREYESRGNFVVADMETFAYPNQIDIVFAFASFLHLPKEELLQVLQKVHAHLAPGGIVYISVKKGEYEEKIIEDSFGPRVFYFYTIDVLSNLAPDQYSVVYTDEQTLAGVDWITLVLRKK